MALTAPTPQVAVAEAALAAHAPALAVLVAETGPCPIGTGKRVGSHFESLCRTVAFQQLAGRAAETIWGRTRALVDGPFTPPAVLAVGEDVLRTAGLSRAKAKAMIDLADRLAMGDVKLNTMSRRPEDDVVAELSRVWGIGRWTAEMFLMFQLGRLDVWPTGDLGVRNGFGRIFGIEPPGPVALEDLGEPFRPYRSVLAWYCWRAVDITTPS